jgi:hypothetical protein
MSLDIYNTAESKINSKWINALVMDMSRNSQKFLKAGVRSSYDLRFDNGFLDMISNALA